MVAILKAGEPKRKESKDSKKKRQYDAHKKRMDKLKEDGMYDEFIDGHKSGHNIARRAEVSLAANPLNTPPHDVAQLQSGCDAYFKEIADKKRDFVTKEGVIVEIKDTYPMTLEGLLCHLGISRHWWGKYESGEGFENYHEIASTAKMAIQKSILEGGLTNKFNAKLSVFYLQNISELRERPGEVQDQGVKIINFIEVKDRKQLQELTKDDPKEEIYDAEVIEDES